MDTQDHHTTDQTGADDAELALLQSDPELAGMFFAEALDHLGSIEATVLALEGAPGDVKLLNDLFRPFHTIKGNSGALGITSVQHVAHKVENLLDLGRSCDGQRREAYRAAWRALAAAERALGPRPSLPGVEAAVSAADGALLRAFLDGLPRPERDALGARLRLRGQPGRTRSSRRPMPRHCTGRRSTTARCCSSRRCARRRSRR